MRKKGLDILRTIAVILVLFRHSELGPHPLKVFGWLGVELFFVLSGFLISGLLFTEYKKTGTVRIKRFLIRRGFKIFPPFYFFLAVTLGIGYAYGVPWEWSKIASECVYLQSYAVGMWEHTWTLAVEEHFYLVFALAMFLLVKRKTLDDKPWMIGGLLSLLLLSFLMRLYVSYPNRAAVSFAFFKTHLRADGIMMGVLLSYLYHFTASTSVLLKHRWLTFVLSCCLVIPGFYYEAGSFFMNTIGINIVNLGFVLWVLLSLEMEPYLTKWGVRHLAAVLCFIGINSYSVYLWHLNAKVLVMHFLDLEVMTMTLIYIVASIVLGIAMSYLIEKTSLKLRDKWFQGEHTKRLGQERNQEKSRQIT